MRYVRALNLRPSRLQPSYRRCENDLLVPIRSTIPQRLSPPEPRVVVSTSMESIRSQSKRRVGVHRPPRVDRGEDRPCLLADLVYPALRARGSAVATDLRGKVRVAPHGPTKNEARISALLELHPGLQSRRQLIAWS
jgi:hypothetical protein